MGLLNAILGGSNAAATMPNGHQYEYDADGNLVLKAPAPGSLVSQAAQAAPTAPLVAAATQPPPPPPSSQDGIDVVGNNLHSDTWRPKKAGILGQIADYLLDTHFGKENTRRNMQGALEHLTSNPTEAIKRLNMVDPEAAEQLYEKVKDNERADGAQLRLNKAADLGIDKYVDTLIAGTLNRANESSNPESMWPKAVARAREIAERYGRPVNLPDVYDPEDADLNSLGVIPPAKQMQMKETHQQHQDLKDYRYANLDERRNYHGQQVSLGRARVGVAAQNANENARHHGVTEKQAATNSDKQPGKAAKVVMVKGSSSGQQYPVLMSPDGTQGILNHNGKKYLYYNINGNLVPQGEIKKK